MKIKKVYKKKIYIYTYIYRMSDTAHFTSRVQIEDVKLNRKVLYYFAIDSIVNEILIFARARASLTIISFKYYNLLILNLN